KHIDGQGRALGGVVCASREFIRKTLEPYMKHTGGSMSPFTAWIMLNGMATLDLRCRAMAASAQKIAEVLATDDRLSRVIFPGLASHPQAELAEAQMGSGGTIVTFDIKGGKAAAFRFMNALDIIKISNNLGDAKTIATHPATTTHQRLPQDQKDLLGITPGLIRLSVGLEDVDDLLAELDHALSVI
ncbi:MAG: PLP-dependent transferase, partial [Paracoccaceae bacterium]